MTPRNSLGLIIALLFSIACESPPNAAESASDTTSRTRDATGRDTARERADTLWLLASNPADDAVHASDTEATLRARYGADNVTPDRIDLGEGQTAPGTVLFPNDSSRRL